MKLQDYHIGPKEILDYMRRPELKCYLDEVLDPERSHEVFIAYTKKWMEHFTAEYKRIERLSTAEMFRICVNTELTGDKSRKAYAKFITNEEFCTYPAIMFAGLDLMDTSKEDIEGRRYRKARLASMIWKQVEPVAAQTDDIRSLITQED